MHAIGCCGIPPSREDFSGEHRRPDSGWPVRTRSFGRAVDGAGRRLRGKLDGFQGVQRRSVRDGGALAARDHESRSLGPHVGGRGSHESGGGSGRRAESSQLSANWMAAAGHGAEDAALFDTVRAVALGLCPALGISIPVGKDSLSMRTAWEEGGKAREVIAPLSLIVSAFAPCGDVRRTLTPQLRTDSGETELFFWISGADATVWALDSRAGVSQCGDQAPDLEEPKLLVDFFAAIQGLSREGLILAITTDPTAACSRPCARWPSRPMSRDREPGHARL